MIKKTIDEQIILQAEATFNDGKKIKGSVTLLDEKYNLGYNNNELYNSQYNLAKKEFIVEVKNNKVEYVFKIRDLARELNINPNNIKYVKGWMDSDGDDVYDRLYDLEVFLEVSHCYCNRDFTVEEVKEIVKALRNSENIQSTLLWEPRMSSGISPVDKSYETTTRELNRVMETYNINTCLRKIHFLAQTYHETDRFRAMTEYTSKYTPRYDPYRGRGLVHLTHLATYQKFAQYMNDNTIFVEPTVVATNIAYAFDAGGWYWENLGNTTATNENINIVADSDNTLRVSQCINGRVQRPHGLEERIKYVESLKRIFNYEENH